MRRAACLSGGERFIPAVVLLARGDPDFPMGSAVNFRLPKGLMKRRQLCPPMSSAEARDRTHDGLSSHGTEQEHRAVSAGLNDGAQQGAISKGAQRGPVCSSLQNRGSVPGGGDALALAIWLCLPGLRRGASRLCQDPGALPVYRLSTADIRDRRNDFRATKVPLCTWFRAMYHLTQSKGGISIIELGRRLGITQTTAWKSKHKLMQAMMERDATNPHGRASRADQARELGR